MALLRIKGVVETGYNQASGIPDDMYNRRCRAADANLVRVSLNTHVDDIDGVVESLGKPDFETDVDDHKGPCQWWKVAVKSDKLQSCSPKTFEVRHAQKPGTRYLEIVSNTHFRSAGLKDGDTVIVERVMPDGDE